MDKLSMLSKQLTFMHKELRKVKGFFKSSSNHFNTFYHSMSKSLKEINQGGDLFNDIHYMNYTNINIIRCFTDKIRSQAKDSSAIHCSLKEEGNKVKEIEKEIEKRLKKTQSLTQSQLSTEESKEIESQFKLVSSSIYRIRESIKCSFDTFINQLCTFAETKDTLQAMLLQGEQLYNDASPIISKKLNVLNGKQMMAMMQYGNDNQYRHKSEQKPNECPPMHKFNTSGLGDLVNIKDKSRSNYFSTEKKIKGKAFQSMIQENPEKECYGDGDGVKGNSGIFKRINSNVLIMSPDLNKGRRGHKYNDNDTLLNQNFAIEDNRQFIDIAQIDHDDDNDDEDNNNNQV